MQIKGLILYGLCFGAQAIELELEHKLSTEHSNELTDSARPRIQHQFRLDTDAYFNLNKHFDLVVGTRITAEHHQKISKSSSAAQIRQLYLQADWLNVQWQLGKQYDNWKEMDGFTAFAMLSPRDVTQSILQDFDTSALGQWMLKTSIDDGEYSWQTALVWQVKGHRLPEVDELFAFRASRLRYGFDYHPGNAGLERRYQQPSTPVLATRYQRQLLSWSWGAQWRIGPDFEPIGDIIVEQNKTLLQQKHLQRQTLSLHANTQWDNTVWRTQLSVSPQRYFNRINRKQGLFKERLDQVNWAVGVDWNGPWQLFVNAQLMLDKVINAPADLVRPETDIISSLLVRRSFTNQKWQMQLRWYASNHADGLWRWRLDYSALDWLDIATGADIFYGKQDTLFGQYQDRDRLFIKLLAYF